MSRPVTIVMYHYVRDLEHSRFPAIKGLSLERFRRQLDYIESNYTPVSVEALRLAIETDNKSLPANPILLTFDDGYIDHYTNVFPLLDSRGIQGCFFPSAQAVLEQTVMDVNKVQFILASVRDVDALLDKVFVYLEDFRSNYELKSREDYFAAFVEKHRYDTREVTVFKRLLQRDLPELVRAEIINRLFAEYVTCDEATFARELYMSAEQIACMRRHGMHIGCHGYRHVWLNHVSQTEQTCEIDRSLTFLREFGVSSSDWTMCYPFGGFDDALLRLLRNRECRLGFTVEARIADLDSDDRLTLPRIDTNDLPS